MRFAEVRNKYAKYLVYSGWCTIAEAKITGMIPEQYFDLFDNLCECGSENIIAPNMKRETCCDPNCPIKIGHAIAEMFSRFGIKGLGYSTCSRIYKELLDHDACLKEHGQDGLFRFGVYTEILLLKSEQFPVSIAATAAGYNFISACQQIANTQVTFPQLIGYLGIASLGSNSGRLFDGINSYSELQRTVEEEGGVIKFCISRGVQSNEVIFNVANGLRTIAVADLACQNSIRYKGLQEFDVCITGRVFCDGRSMTKKEFISACNQICIDKSGVQLFEFENKSGAVTVPFVLYSAASGSEKYNTGLRRGVVCDEFGRHRVLMNVTDFYNFLKGAMEEWNKILDGGETGRMDCLKVFSKVLTNFSETGSFSMTETVTENSSTTEAGMRPLGVFQTP